MRRWMFVAALVAVVVVMATGCAGRERPAPRVPDNERIARGVTVSHDEFRSEAAHTARQDGPALSSVTWCGRNHPSRRHECQAEQDQAEDVIRQLKERGLITAHDVETCSAPFRGQDGGWADRVRVKDCLSEAKGTWGREMHGPCTRPDASGYARSTWLRYDKFDRVTLVQCLGDLKQSLMALVPHDGKPARVVLKVPGYNRSTRANLLDGSTLDARPGSPDCRGGCTWDHEIDLSEHRLSRIAGEGLELKLGEYISTIEAEYAASFLELIQGVRSGWYEPEKDGQAHPLQVQRPR